MRDHRGEFPRLCTGCLDAWVKTAEVRVTFDELERHEQEHITPKQRKRWQRLRADIDNLGPAYRDPNGLPGLTETLRSMLCGPRRHPLYGKVMDLDRRGYSNVEIAARLGVNVVTVWRIKNR